MLLDGSIYWVESETPNSWMSSMSSDKSWIDQVFLHIVANFFNKLIVIIPLSPESAHHARMYSKIESYHGGSGNPLFMLYYEEWRTCGHYQSIEIDPEIKPNKVLQHLEWCKNRSAMQSSNSSLPTISSISRLLQANSPDTMHAPLSPLPAHPGASFPLVLPSLID